MRATYGPFLAALIVCSSTNPTVGFAQAPCTTTLSCAQAAVDALAKAQAEVKVLADKLLADEKLIAALQVQYGTISFPPYPNCGNPVSVTTSQTFPKAFPAGVHPEIVFGLNSFRNYRNSNYNFGVAALNSNENGFTAILTSDGGGACLNGATFTYIAIP
jgi:hypothetical protein